MKTFMRYLSGIIFYAAVFYFGTCLAAPQFVTGRMIDRRNGLTDAQYEALWKIGKNPEIKQSVARDWVYRSARYTNVTNWLDTCGKTNDFAALSFALQGDNFRLSETNAVLSATNKWLTATCVTLAEEAARQWTAYTNQLARTAAFSNLYAVASAQAQAATAKIADEIADLQAKIAKYEEYKTKYPLLKTIWTAMIADAENRVKILQALTGGGR